MTKHPAAPSWRIVGTASEGTFCHKPSTVSGGGKSEISKSINDAVIYNPLFVSNMQEDLDKVQAIVDKDIAIVLNRKLTSPKKSLAVLYLLLSVALVLSLNY